MTGDGYEFMAGWAKDWLEWHRCRYALERQYYMPRRLLLGPASVPHYLSACTSSTSIYFIAAPYQRTQELLAQLR